MTLDEYYQALIAQGYSPSDAQEAVIQAAYPNGAPQSSTNAQVTSAPSPVATVANAALSYGKNKAIGYGVDKAASALGYGASAPDAGIAAAAQPGFVGPMPEMVGPMPEAVSAGGADVATGATGFMSTPLESLGGMSPTQGLGALGAAKGAYDSYGGFMHGGTGLRAGTTELGAGIGTMILPGVGTIIGAGLGNAVGYGMKRFGMVHKTTAQLQQESRDKLLKAGTTGYSDYLKNSYANQSGNAGGKVDASTAADFVGMDKNGKWVNNKFAASRNEADLRPEDIVGSDAMFQKYGNDYLGKMSPQQRLDAAKAALDAHAVSEGKGMMNIDWSKVNVSPTAGASPVQNAAAATIKAPAAAPAQNLSTDPASIAALAAAAAKKRQGL